MQYFLHKHRYRIVTAFALLIFTVTPITAHAACEGLFNPIGGSTLGECINFGLAWVAEAILSFFAVLVWATGDLLNVATQLTVLEMGANINNVDAINVAWTAFRDLANIILIFALIAIGIATILRLEPYGAKKMLATLIVVALLLNFSLFFTKFVIDSTNLLAVQFWKSINIGGKGGDGLSDAFMAPMRLTSIYDFRPGDLSVEQDSEELRLEQAQNTGGNRLTASSIVTIALMGTILFLIAAFIFAATAILLIVRFIVLIILMVTSPLAFVAMVVPHTSGLARKWWHTLLNYSLFAPAYFALTWVALRVIKGLSETPTFGASEGAGFWGVATGDGGFVLVLLNFFIVIGLMVASLLIARDFGIRGGSAAVSIGSRWGRNTAGYFGAQTGGRLFRGARSGWTNIASWAQSGSDRFGPGRLQQSQSRIARTVGHTLGTTLKPVKWADRALNAGLRKGEEARYGGAYNIADIISADKARSREIEDRQQERALKRAEKDVEKNGANASQASLNLLATASQRQLEELGAIRLANENVARNLTANQLENISRSNEFSEQEKANVIAARFKQVVDAAERGDGKAVRALSDKETELMGSLLRNDAVVREMTDGQRDAVKKSNLLSSTLKQQVKEKWNKQFADLLAAAAGGSPAELEKKLGEMTPAGIAGLDDDFLVDKATGRANSHLMSFVTPAALMEMTKSKNANVRKAIRAHMTAATTSFSDAEKQSHEWLTKANTPLGMIF